MDARTATSPDDRASRRPEWLDAVAWPFPSHVLDTPVGSVSVTDVGDGPTLLLVHTGFWSFVWRDLIRELQTDFRCVTLDCPGTGASSRPKSSADVTLPAASQAIGAVMDSIAGEFTLVLHDLGGLAGLHAAAGRPTRVAGLVAVNACGWRPSGAAFRGMLALMGSAPVRELDSLTGFLPRASSTRFGVGRHMDRHDRKVFRAGIDRQARRSFHRYMRSARKERAMFDVIEAAVAGPLADKPLLTIFGQWNDPLRFQPKWKQRYPDARQLVVPRGMHFPMCDAPGLVTQEIGTWHRDTVAR